jgi:hypothetical protein
VCSISSSQSSSLLTYEHRNQLHARKGKDPVFGNDVYTIRFEERDHKGLFGHKYIFFLRDAVENVPEYVVVWDNFVQSVFHTLLLKVCGRN